MSVDIYGIELTLVATRRLSLAAVHRDQPAEDLAAADPQPFVLLLVGHPAAQAPDRRRGAQRKRRGHVQVVVVDGGRGRAPRWPRAARDTCPVPAGMSYVACEVTCFVARRDSGCASHDVVSACLHCSGPCVAVATALFEETAYRRGSLTPVRYAAPGVSNLVAPHGLPGGPSGRRDILRTTTHMAPGLLVRLPHAPIMNIMSSSGFSRLRRRQEQGRGRGAAGRRPQDRPQVVTRRFLPHAYGRELSERGGAGQPSIGV